MPAVPSSRGCEACRKQKKKCDQVKPSCSRCARLSIACEGSGQQRYMFKDQTLMLQKSQKLCIATYTATPSRISRNPSNGLTALSSSFISAVEVKDLRYDISAFVPFARFVPQRLGRNNALDAAIGTLTLACPCIRTNTISVEVLQTYGRALKELRICLDDPTEATTVETLAAIYLIMIIQGWIEQGPACNGQKISHGEILVHILNAATYQDWKGEFEVEMLLSMTYLVLFSSAFNPKIKLDPWYPKALDIYKSSKLQAGEKDSSAPGPGCDNNLKPDALMSITTLDLTTIRRITAVLREPEANFSEIQALYQTVQIDLQVIDKSLHDAMELMAWRTDGGGFPGPDTQLARLFRDGRTAQGLLLTLALTMNAILRAFNPPDDQLVQESEAFCQEILDAGYHMAQYRPMGANYVPATLAAVIAVVDDIDKCKEAESMLKDYSMDFRGMRYMDTARWLKTAFRRLQTKIAIQNLLDSNGWAPIEVETTDIWDAGPPPDNVCFVQ